MKIWTDSDFNEVSGSTSEFFRRTPVRGLTVVDRLPSALDMKVRKAVLAKKRSAWYDEDTHRIMIYGPNVSGNVVKVDFWQSVILKECLERFGLSRLFVEPRFASLVAGRLSAVAGRPGLDMVSLERFFAVLDRDTGKGFEDIFRDSAKVLCALTGLRYSEKFSVWALKTGITWFVRRETDREMSQGDYLMHSRMVNAEIASVLGISGDDAGRVKMLDMGLTSDAYVRIGYPERHLVLSSQVLRNFCSRQGFDLSGVDIVSAIQNPLAIFRSDSHLRADGGQCYVVVTDISKMDDYGRKYMCFSLDSPRCCVDRTIDFERSAKKDSTILVTPVEMSIGKISYNLRNADNWCYMRPLDGPDGTDYELPRIITKNGVATSPVMNSGSSSQLLHIANIANSFHNPMSCEKFSSLLGYGRDAVGDALRERKKIGLLLEPGKPDDVMKIRFPSGLFSKASAAKLADAGIRNIGDAVNAGFGRIREITGNIRAVNQVAGFLADNGVFMYSDSESASFVKSPSEEDIRSHLVESLFKASSRSGSIDVGLPRKLSGECFLGSDAIHLMAHEVTVKSRSSGDIWVTEKELTDYGCVAGKAEPVPVHVDGRAENVYNLSRTSFPKNYPDEYGLLVDSFKVINEPVLKARNYFSSVIPKFAGMLDRQVEGFCKFLESSPGDSFSTLGTSKVPSIDKVLGEKTMKELVRHGKVLKMFNYAEAALNSAKKSRTPGK